jgi:hypothetical protein
MMFHSDHRFVSNPAEMNQVHEMPGLTAIFRFVSFVVKRINFRMVIRFIRFKMGCNESSLWNTWTYHRFVSFVSFVSFIRFICFITAPLYIGGCEMNQIEIRHHFKQR